MTTILIPTVKCTYSPSLRFEISQKFAPFFFVSTSWKEHHDGFLFISIIELSHLAITNPNATTEIMDLAEQSDLITIHHWFPLIRPY